MNFDPVTGEPMDKETQNNETVNNETVNTEEVNNAAAFDSVAEMSADNGGKKKKKIGLIAGCVAAVVVIIGIVAAVLISSGAFSSKEKKVARAIENTFEESSELMEALNVGDILESKKYTLGINASVQNYDVEVAYKVKDAEQQITGDIGMGGIINMDFAVGMSKDKIMAKIPFISDKVFSYSYKGEKNGYLTEQMAEEEVKAFDKLLERICDTEAQEQLTEELRDVLLEEAEKLEYKEAPEKTFKVDGKDRKCEGYTVAVSYKNVENVLNAWEKIYKESYKELEDIMAALGESYEGSYSEMFAQLKEQLADMPEMSLTFYIYDKALSCVDLEVEGEEIQFQFQGGDRRTQNMCLANGKGDVAMEIKGSTDGDKEVTELCVDGMSVIKMEYDTKNGDFTLSANDESASFSGNIASDKKGFEISVDEISASQGSVPFDGKISLKAGAEIEEITGEEFDFGNASESEFMDLMQEISTNLGMGY